MSTYDEKIMFILRKILIIPIPFNSIIFLLNPMGIAKIPQNSPKSLP